MKTQRRKLPILLEILLLIPILIFLNVLSDKYFRRLDLTEDGRFTLSEASKELISKLPGDVLVKFYYAGEMPTYYMGLQQNLGTFLKELKYYSDGHLDFAAIDPRSDPKIYANLAAMKLDPFPIVDPVSPVEVKEQLVLPYAEITYKGKTQYVNLIRGCTYRTERGRFDFDVYKAMRNVEYNIVATIYNMQRERTHTLGILTGHEPMEIPKDRLRDFYSMGMSDLWPELDAFYNIIFVDIRDGRPITPKELDVLMVIQPDTALSEREKYEIDQYLMRGGKAIFMLDQQRIDWSIGEQGSTVTDLRASNLDDMFMKWGVAVRYNIIQDQVCGFIDASTFSNSLGSNMQEKPWLFHPLAFDFSDHPVTRNLSNCLIRFGGSIDTLASPGISHQVLMRTSRYSRLLDNKQYINVDQVLNQRIDERLFNAGPQNVAVLLSGTFRSLFTDRQPPLSPSGASTQGTFIPQNTDISVPKIAIISDGEFPLDMPPASQQMGKPDNKAFVLNLVDLMSGQEIVSQLREREVVKRQLNVKKSERRKGMIYFLNLGLPLLLIILMGMGYSIIRRRVNRK